LRIALTADPEIPVPPVLYGGIERVVDMLARGLVEAGHEVTVFSHAGSTTAGRLVPWPGLSSRSRIDTVRNAAMLSRHVLARRFDLVHSFSRVAYLAPLLPLPIPKLMTYQREISRRSVRLGHALSRGTLWFSAISRQMMRDVMDVGTWRLVFNGVPLATYDFQPQPGPDAPLVFSVASRRSKARSSRSKSAAVRVSPSSSPATCRRSTAPSSKPRSNRISTARR
jgi:glycosyltransferase involved in cell wall biosynthesis